MLQVACLTIPPLCAASGKLAFKLALYLPSIWQRQDGTRGSALARASAASLALKESVCK